MAGSRISTAIYKCEDEDHVNCYHLYVEGSRRLSHSAYDECSRVEKAVKSGAKHKGDGVHSLARTILAAVEKKRAELRAVWDRQTDRGEDQTFKISVQ